MVKLAVTVLPTGTEVSGRARRARAAAFVSACATLFFACGKSEDGVSLSKVQVEEVPDIPVPPADGPVLGATSHATPVHRVPSKESPVIGYLHAGAKVTRATEAYSHDDCNGGWYPIRPRGFVCLDEGATIDPRHPTLATMAIQPNPDSPMPYAYARTLEDTALLEVSSGQESRVKEVGTVPSRSGLAVVGSWQAEGPKGKPIRLAMMTNGQFVNARQLEQAAFSEFSGVSLKGADDLPVGYVVKRGVFQWEVTGPKLDRGKPLEFHQQMLLTGRFRDIREQKFWELENGNWVRHRDITAIRARESVPAFVKPGQKWLDISIVTGTLVAYEGTEPAYATLVSVGRGRLGEEGVEDQRVTKRGEFKIIGKHLTALNAKVKSFANRVNIYDAPWTLELESGQFMHGAYWHNRFGIEHGPGNIQLAPADARWIWHWVTPVVPPGWHAVVDGGVEELPTLVNIRK